MAIEDIPHPGDTDLTKFPPPKEGEPWSITRWGIEIDGIGPFPYDTPPERLPELDTELPDGPYKRRREAARRALEQP